MICRPVLVRAAAALLFGALLVVPATATTAAAAADAGGAVTWSVQPADGAGPDGRPWIEQDLDPGESVVEHLAVHNFGGQDVTFGLTAADGLFNEDGRFTILPASRTSTAAGTWIDLVDSVTVPAGATSTVPFTITVPADAEPGDHAAGVAASVVSTSTGAGGASVGVESRVGFRVMTRVSGTLAPGATIENVTSSYRSSWNPFAPGDLTVELDVVNTGNTRLRVTGVVTAGGRATTFPSKEQPQELLVGDTRRLVVSVADVWPSVLVPVSVTVDPQVVVVSGEAPALASIGSGTTAVVMPWPQLMVLVGVSSVVVALVWQRRQSRRRLHALLDDARNEGRRSVLDAGAQRV
ncbi:DUF916 domain-containing protein [Cellulomonas terrae]|uniref:DUF916 domain-containing protein n=1 Tax=Cellulomonas terrae TaxID=311234 RepID=A0A511JIQ5_9CELL|nr:DUF916 domain-containing protein [Cellulomonas terrae]GEL97785.1 hypothetical protein CTE05_13320 [Cellulomonas terrae]